MDVQLISYVDMNFIYFKWITFGILTMPLDDLHCAKQIISAFIKKKY